MGQFTEKDVVKALGNMNVMQLIALTKELESKWGVEGKPQVQEGTSPNVEVQENTQTEFNLTLVSYPPEKKITLVKLVRELLGLGLLESKSLVESVPKMIKEGGTKEEVEALRVKLTEAGATVEVK